MSLTKLVPAMGLIAAASVPAMGVEVVNGILEVEGYVDTVFSYERYQKNAPRSGTIDNANTWNTQYRQGIPLQITVNGGNATVGFANVIPTVNQGRFSYFGGDPVTTPAFGGTFFQSQTFNLANLRLALYGENSEEQTSADFSATAELDVIWHIGEDVHTRFDVEWSDANGTTLEQAFISWDFAEGWNVSMGKYINWLGYETTDPTGLYRVNTSLVTGLLGELVTGVRLGWTPIDEEDQSLNMGLHVVDRIYGDPLGLKDGNDLGVGFEITYANSAFGFINLDLMYDVNATYDWDAYTEVVREYYVTPGIYSLAGVANLLPAQFTPGNANFIGFNGLLWNEEEFREDVFGIDINGEISALREDTGLLFAFDFSWVDYDIAETWAIMGMVNWQFREDMSVTFMASHWVPNTEDPFQELVPTGGTAFNTLSYFQGENLEETEIALALLTNPTGSENFAVNFELQYNIRDDVEGEVFSLQAPAPDFDYRNTIGFYVEFLAVIP